MANDSMGNRTRSEYNLIPIEKQSRLKMSSDSSMSKKQRKFVSLIIQIAIEDRPFLAKWLNKNTWKFLNEGHKK